MSSFTGSNDNGPNYATAVSEFPTDVQGINANGYMPMGTEKFPIFDVSRAEFYQDSTRGRQFQQFDQQSNIGQYLNKTQYNRPIYLRHKGEDGQAFIKKI